MIYQDLYMNSALFYFAGVLGFWLCVWKISTKLPWRPLRWWLTWLYLCVVLTPWQSSGADAYYAPAIIVAAFDFLDVGIQQSLLVLKPMINALVVGTAVIVLLAIVLKIRDMKRVQISPEEA